MGTEEVQHASNSRLRLRQWLWFIGLWAAGVLALTLVSLLFRSVMSWMP